MENTTERIILDKAQFALTIERLGQQLIEEYDDFADACMVGIQPRGSLFADRLHAYLLTQSGVLPFDYGRLDITFYRDDFRTKPLRASVTEMDFLVENKRVILVDDVLYTGRTVQAALTALQHYGRPKTVDLVALVDRRFNRHLPIQGDFVGITVDALDEVYVKVNWAEKDGVDKVIIY